MNIDKFTKDKTDSRKRDRKQQATWIVRKKKLPFMNQRKNTNVCTLEVKLDLGTNVFKRMKKKTPNRTQTSGQNCSSSTIHSSVDLIYQMIRKSYKYSKSWWQSSVLTWLFCPTSVLKKDLTAYWPEIRASIYLNRQVVKRRLSSRLGFWICSTFRIFVVVDVFGLKRQQIDCKLNAI